MTVAAGNSVRGRFEMKCFDVRTARPAQTLDITGQVRAVVAEGGKWSGAALVWCPHTTAGIYCNEGADPDVVTDVESTLEQMVPPRQEYLHAEGNSHAHIRSILTGCSLLVPVEDGELKLGTWQHVFFSEFDGPRVRQVWVQFLQGL